MNTTTAQPLRCASGRLRTTVYETDTAETVRAMQLAEMVDDPEICTGAMCKSRPGGSTVLSTANIGAHLSADLDSDFDGFAGGGGLLRLATIIEDPSTSAFKQRRQCEIETRTQKSDSSGAM
ncbi:hypothetical protein [Devosia sp. A369]